MAFTLDGYTILERISSTPHSDVFAATRNGDGLHVVLKHYRSLDRPERAARRARSEFSLLQRIDSPGVIRGLALEPFGDGFVLVVQRFAGIPLCEFIKKQPVEPETFLALAEQVTASLAAIHRARIIHKDIKLSNILIDPDTRETCIIDLGIAAEIGDTRRSESDKPAEGTLSYIAPEQTGRIGLGIDFRTDLYSLGATFYSFLTRTPVFDTKDTLELIHAHIAAVPTPPSVRDPEVPEALSRVVMKLLEKDPERRYQTAWGLHADLRSLREQLEETGQFPKAFELGRHDSCDRLRFSKTLYGREREIEELQTALERTLHGSNEVLLIAGPAGIGKSSLIDALRNEVIATGGYLTQAQFDPDRRQQPYLGFAAAFASLVDQILAESGERIERWRHRLREGLGRIGRALIDLVPSAAYLIEDFPEIPQLAPNEAQDRLALAVRRFVEAFATPGRPLVVFFDDLQWADPGSRFLMESLISSPETKALMIIGTYRTSTGVDSPVPRAWLERISQGNARVRTLELQALSLENTRRMLADLLGRDGPDTEALADCIGRKTQHNPLLLRRLLEHLWERDLITYRHESGWIWDQREIAEIEISEDAAELLSAKIESLEGGPGRVLRTASVLGRSFDVELLVGILGLHRGDLLQMLMALTDEGLVAPCRDGFRFVHDRIREAACATVPMREQEQLHYQAAVALMQRGPANELGDRIFEVVEHMNRALPVLPGSEAMRSVELNLEAGSLALRSGASHTAMQYLATARGLLPDGVWESHRSLCIELFHASADATYQTGDFESALQLLDRIEVHCADELEKVRVDAKRIEVFALSRTPQEAFELATQCLRRAGIALPKAPSRLRIFVERLRTDWYVRGQRMMTKFIPARNPNRSTLAIIWILNVSASPLAHRSSRLTFLALAFLLRTYARHGWVSPPQNILAAYGIFRIAITRSPRGAERFRRAALEWMERAPDRLHNIRTTHMTRAWIDPWLGPRRAVIEPLAAAAEDLFEAGELVRASNCLNIRACYLGLIGEPLLQVRREFDKLASIANRNFASAYAHELTSLSALRDGARVDVEAALCELEESLQRLPSVFVLEGVRWVATLCFLGSWRRALRFAERVEPYVLDVIAMCTHVADFEFFRGMAAAVLCVPTRGWLRGPHAKTLRRSRRLLDRWAAFNPDFVHMLLGLDAERLRLRGKREAAITLYERAIEQAIRQGYIHHAALFRERRSELLRCLTRGVHAERDLQSAIALYTQWGAEAKVSMLRQSLRDS